MSQLNDAGVCIIQWTKYADEKYQNDTDCFGASMKEYGDLIHKLGYVYEIKKVDVTVEDVYLFFIKHG